MQIKALKKLLTVRDIRMKINRRTRSNNTDLPIEGIIAMTLKSKASGRFDSRIEALELRRMLAISATFTPANGVLSVVGDAQPNSISVTRNLAGTIFVNGGAVPVTGGPATVANTVTIQVYGQEGADMLWLDESNGALPVGSILGGADNDTITGGSGADLLFGHAGDDVIMGRGGADSLFGGEGDDVLIGGDADDQCLGSSGDDLMIWNPGDDTDLNEGESGSDTVEINGGGGAEVFAVSRNGDRVRAERVSPAPFVIDIGTSEHLLLNANAGDDAPTIESATPGFSITVNGGAGNDHVTVVDMPAGAVTVNTGNELSSPGDTLTVNPDFADAGDEPATVIVDEDDVVGVLNVMMNGTLRVTGNAVLKKATGIFDVQGTIDVAGGALLGALPFASTLTFLNQGYNNGAWNGTSNTGAINSSIAAASSTSDGVGYGFGSEISITSIGSFTIAPTDLLVRYTLNGDTNLDQSVNFNDLLKLSQNYNPSVANKSWTQGNFNYNTADNVVGAVGFADLLRLSQNYNHSVAMSADIASRFSIRMIDEINQN